MKRVNLIVKVRLDKALSFGAAVLSLALVACSMTVDITDKASSAPEIKKTQGAEMVAGANRQKTNRGYIVESQIGHPFGAIVSKTDKNFTVYHSVRMGVSAE
jgi:hypothetical protein